jgi:hypothetical protein
VFALELDHFGGVVGRLCLHVRSPLACLAVALARRVR